MLGQDLRLRTVEVAQMLRGRLLVFTRRGRHSWFEHYFVLEEELLLLMLLHGGWANCLSLFTLCFLALFLLSPLMPFC